MGSSILAWETSCAEEPGVLQSMVSQRIRHDWACTCARWVREAARLYPEAFWIKSSQFVLPLEWMKQFPASHTTIQPNYQLVRSAPGSSLTLWRQELRSRIPLKCWTTSPVPRVDLRPPRKPSSPGFSFRICKFSTHRPGKDTVLFLEHPITGSVIHLAQTLLIFLKK